MKRDADTLFRQWCRRLTLVYALLIAVVTLLPFEFSAAQPAEKFAQGWTYFFVGSQMRLSNIISDTIFNIVAFIPLGLFFSGWVTGKNSRNKPALLKALLFGATLSLVVEIAQFWLPQRFPSPLDIATNAAGALFGALLFRRVHPGMVWIFQQFSAKTPGRRNAAIWLGVTVVYLTGWLVLSLYFVKKVSLDSWDLQHPLSIANEHSGHRPWQGNIRQVTLFAEALSDDDIVAAFDRGAPPAAPLLNLNFGLPGGGGLDNPLSDQWIVKDPQAVQIGPEGLHAAGGWLTTVAPPEGLMRALQQQNAFTLCLDFEPATLENTGPARIFSIAPHPWLTNLMVGQHLSNLYVRLLTTVSDPYALNPVVIVENALKSHEPVQLAIVYDGSAVWVSANGRQIGKTLTLAPEVAILRYLFIIRDAWSIVFHRLFYILVFFPAGILLIPAVAFLDKNAGIPGFFRWGIVALPAVGFCLLFAGFAGRSPDWVAMATGVTASLIGFGLFYVNRNPQAMPEEKISPDRD